MVHQLYFGRNIDDSYSLRNLPVEVMASVLGTYSSGKTISTFVLVVYGDCTLRSTAYTICRNALVERYVALSFKVKHIYMELELDTEIPDILDIIREDIRLSNDDDDQIMYKFSHWCAILDYFEVQLEATTSMVESQVPTVTCPQWIVWCGQMEITYGEITAYISTPDWNVCALHYWTNQEASQLSLTHPRNNEFVFIPDDQIPYGTLFGMNSSDRLRLERQCSDLEVHTLRDTTSAQRFTLVPLNESYDECPSMIVVDHSYICRSHAENIMVTGPLLIDSRRQSLCCCWDKELSEDLWDDAISHFGEHAIRIMRSFGCDFSSTMLTNLYKSCREFSNSKI
jgi:hypothetical protein